MEFINLILTITISLIAVGVSVFNLFLIRKEIYNKTITTERVKWINTVRQLIADFIETYTLDDNNERRLIFIKAHIELFLNHKNSDHYELSNTLGNYLDNKNLSVNELITISQVVFKNSWERMKWEAGFTKKKEEEIQKIIYTQRT